MKPVRIITRLDIKGPNLVKGIHLEGLRVIGKPEDFANRYYVDGVDELLYIDVVASLYGRNSLIEIVKRTASSIFIPLTVGGGIRSIDDMTNILRAGADKVAINTAAIKDPSLIRRGAETFGSQCIVVSIEAKKMADGKYEAYTDNGRERTGVDVFEWAVKAHALGAGELLVTSIDKEGTGGGYDIDLLKEVISIVPIPVVACGGAGKMAHFLDVIKAGAADAVCAASVFHYNQRFTSVNEQHYAGEGNIEFIKKTARDASHKNQKMEYFSVAELKTFLASAGVRVRPNN